MISAIIMCLFMARPIWWVIVLEFLFAVGFLPTDNKKNNKEDI